VLSTPLQQPSPVRLDTIVQRTLDESSPPSDITVDIHTSPCLVLGDELLLSQLFRNLLDNALRHNIPSGTVSLLFEPFHRGPTRTDGAGLGLSIVRAITLAHRGHITAHPGPSGGLTITAEIPLSSNRSE